MKICKSCKKEIEDKATKCSHCSTDQRIWFAKHPILTVILVLILIGMFGSGSNDNTQSANSSNASPTSEQTAISGDQNTVLKAEVEKTEEKQPSVPTEYKSALNKATSYANTMNMSKKGVYAQLTSDYGEKFSAEAAQYAIDNVKADWNANALAKAKSYQSSMSMSRSRIHDQLTSDYGEKFTKEEADYALENLE